MCCQRLPVIIYGFVQTTAPLFLVFLETSALPHPFVRITQRQNRCFSLIISSLAVHLLEFCIGNPTSNSCLYNFLSFTFAHTHQRPDSFFNPGKKPVPVWMLVGKPVKNDKQGHCAAPLSGASVASVQDFSRYSSQRRSSSMFQMWH